MQYGKFPDLTGQRFDKITVIDGKLPQRKVLVRCDCGIEKTVSRYDVFNGKIKSCGNKGCTNRTHNLVNQKFGNLLVIKLAETSIDIINRCTQWECKCDCGKVLVIPSNQLSSGRTQSCGCTKGARISKKNSVPVKIRVEKELFNNYKYSAKRRGIEFQITRDQFISFLYNNCYYCESPPIGYYTKKRVTGDEKHYFNGIDRVDNKLGYVLENCITCCKYCNQAKSDLSKEEFISLVKKIAFRF